MVWDLCCFEDLEEKDRSLDQLINDGGVCRTAPATPGLLKILNHAADNNLVLRGPLYSI